MKVYSYWPEWILLSMSDFIFPSFVVVFILVFALECWFGLPTGCNILSRILKSLHPIRMLKLAYELFWFIIDLPSCIILCIKWFHFYKKIDHSCIVKDVSYCARVGHKLDIYTTNSDKESPVVIFIFGGAWGSGSKWMYGMLGMSLSQTAKVTVVIPDYTLHPNGDMCHMMRDIYSVLDWTIKHISHYNGDPARITFMGHSAGAHLCSLFVMALEAFSTTSDLYLTKDIFSELAIDVNLVPKLKSAIRNVIGIAGVYSISDHYLHEAKRGVEFISPMIKVALGENNFARFSPLYICEQLSMSRKLSGIRFFLVHGNRDATVPSSSSHCFQKCLLQKGYFAQCVVVVSNHTELLFSLYSNTCNSALQSQVINCVIDAIMSP